MSESNSRPSILVNGQISEDAWRSVDDESPVPSEGDVIVSLARWQRDRPELGDRLGRTAVRLDPEHSGRELADAFDALDMIVVDFPKFTDGRGYTIARRLREQLGWRKALRAQGDVLPDQVFFMQRCGFDVLALRADKSLETAQRALSAFSVSYQGAADDPRPLYRRRPEGVVRSARAS